MGTTDNVHGQTRDELEKKGYYVSQWDNKVKDSWGNDVKNGLGQTHTYDYPTAQTDRKS